MSNRCSLFAFSRKWRGRGPSDLSVFVYSVSDLINSPIEINNYPHDDCVGAGGSSGGIGHWMVGESEHL